MDPQIRLPNKRIPNEKNDTQKVYTYMIEKFKRENPPENRVFGCPCCGGAHWLQHNHKN